MSFRVITKLVIYSKNLQFEHFAFPKLGADPEDPREELGGVEGRGEELEFELFWRTDMLVSAEATLNKR
ncbi:hypothetical protein Tco_1537321 [Tanacetum coccineum]